MRQRHREDIRREYRFAAWGAVIGLAFGIAEALLSSMSSTPFWFTVKIHFSQFGFACPMLGAVIGSIIARRIEGARRRRECDPICPHCGYNLTGNTSGRCPECGKSIEAE